MAEQIARPPSIAETLKRLHIPQATLAEFAGLSQPALSLFLCRKKGLSVNAQLALFKGLQFLIGLAQQTGAPVDFSNIDALRPLWRAHLKLECERELVFLADQQQA